MTERTPEQLSALARNDDALTRCVAARNLNTPASTLTALAHDEDETVRDAVAQNPATPPSALNELSRDQYDNIRAAVAWNRSTPADTLQHLTRDPSRAVAARAQRNPKLTGDGDCVADLQRTWDSIPRTRAGDVAEGLRNLIADDTLSAARKTATNKLLNDDTPDN